MFTGYADLTDADEFCQLKSGRQYEGSGFSRTFEELAGPHGNPPYVAESHGRIDLRPRAHLRQLDDGTPSSCGKMDHQQDDADDEEDPRDLGRDRSNARRSKYRGNYTDNQKYQRVIQHSNTSLS